MNTVFGTRRPLEDTLDRSIQHACRDYGFDMDPVLRKMIVEQTKRDLIYGYTNGRIGATDCIFVPLTGKTQFADEVYGVAA